MRSLAAVLAVLVGVTTPVAGLAQALAPAPGIEAPGRTGPFRLLSDAGRRTMHAAMRAANVQADHNAVDAARDRMLTVLEADRLDVDALRRAMDDERQAAIAAKTHQQAAMITGFQQLSLADRRAFVTEARTLRDEVKARIADARRPRAGSLVLPAR